jgi:AcrR family transcriptional regulator
MAKTTATKTAKGAQARNKLKRAALIVLEREGFHKMRIADVTNEAGVATGLFYHYFPDLKSLTIEVLTDFVSASQNIEAIEKNVPKGDWYERILAHNQLVVKSYSERPGLMRCLLQLSDEDEPFAALLRKSFIEQLSWLVKLMPRLFPKASLSEHQALMVVYSLAGSSERILRDFYINKDSTLRKSKVSDNEIAELLTVIFYRGLFLENPPADKMQYTKNLQQMIR